MYYSFWFALFFGLALPACYRGPSLRLSTRLSNEGSGQFPTTTQEGPGVSPPLGTPGNPPLPSINPSPPLPPPVPPRVNLGSILYSSESPLVVEDFDGDGLGDIAMSSSLQVGIFQKANAIGNLTLTLGAGETWGNGAALSVAAIPASLFGPASLIVGTGKGMDPRVFIFRDLARRQADILEPYDSKFRGGVRVAACDVNGDGVTDIITGAGPGGGPHVKVFDGVNLSEIDGFMAYDPAFNGGVYVACADVDSNGRGEILTGAGESGGPHVKLFLFRKREPVLSFFAYGKDFNGGVRVAVGDLDGDGISEIITGAGPGGGPHLRVFDGLTGLEKLSTFVRPARGRETAGIWVAFEPFLPFDGPLGVEFPWNIMNLANNP